MTKHDKINQSVIFTRYLYVKNQVILSLILSLLKREEECIFWGFELFYSGYKTELLEIIVKIYYDFYAVLNPTFEKILFQKIDQCNLIFKENNDIKENKETPEFIIYNLLQNLKNCYSSIDIFMLKILTEKTTIKKEKKVNKEWSEIIMSFDFKEITKKIVCSKNPNTEIEIVLDCFCKLLPDKYKETDKKIDIIRWKKYKKYVKNHTSFFLSRMMSFCKLYKDDASTNNLKTKKKHYIVFDVLDISSDINLYNSSNDVILPRKLLQFATKFSIQEVEFLELFCSSIDVKHYHYNWLYYASFSPIWDKRIRENNGKIDNENKSVEFDDEDIETFYEKYGYEPDEQPIEIQNRNIGKLRPLNKERIDEFIDKYNKNGFIKFNEIFNEKTIYSENDINKIEIFY